MTYTFAYEKKGIHSDEVWSYGLANSTDGPYIYEDEKTGEVKNCNTWIDGSALHDYITVQKGERFAYGNVYYNLSEDMHPPLYFWILHTICSFFPDQYSLWFGYAINMVSFIVMMIFLYKTMLLVTHKTGIAIATVAYFEMTVGVLNMMTFVRMYAMGMAIAAILVYYHARLYYREQDRTNPRVYVALALWTLVGAMTHHFFLVWAFALAVVFCVYYLVHKNWKQLFAYGGSMLAGALLSFAAFPAVFEHIFNDDTKNNVYSAHYLGLRFQYIMCFMITNLENIGFKLVSPYDEGYKPFLVIGAGAILVLFLGACIVFRNDPWFHDFLQYLRGIPARIWNARKRFNWFLCAMACAVLFNSFVVANVVNIIHMEFRTDRYLCTAYISFIVVLVVFFDWLFCNIIRRRVIVRGVCLAVCGIVLLLANNLFCTRAYLFEPAYDRQDLQNMEPEADVIFVTREQWLLTVCCDKMQSVDQMYVTNYENLQDNKEDIGSLQSAHPLYLVMDVNWMDLSDTDLDVPFKDNNKKEYGEDGDQVVLKEGQSLLDALSDAGNHSRIDTFNQNYNLEKMQAYMESLQNVEYVQYVGYDEVFGRPVLIYRLH